MSLDNNSIHKRFSKTKAKKSWSFEGDKSIHRLTHGYHRYPAKFIPQIVQKLIINYTRPNDKIADVFAGCGTTLVECKVHGRRAVGVDINPVAQLITNAKINPLNPKTLEAAFEQLRNRIAEYSEDKNYCRIQHERINYWFRDTEKNQIAFLLEIINEISNNKLQNFFLCAVSNILKNCSWWLQKGTKPQRDFTKKIASVFPAFTIQVKKMMSKNNEFYETLKQKGQANIYCQIKLKDARKTGIHSNTVNAIITSPPYVTSYEYADIHQLSGYWFEYISDITQFRRKFIGTFYSLNKNMNVPEISPTAKRIVAEMMKSETKWAREIANYFNDLYTVAKEMYRISAPAGVVCLVIGNTEQKGVKIKSAEVLAEMLCAVGYELEEVIKRSIPHKINPTIRNKSTGKFTKADERDSKKVYPNEFVIIARKPVVNLTAHQV